MDIRSRCQQIRSTLVSSLSSDTLNPNADDVDVRLPDDSDASPGVLHSSLTSVSPADFTSVELATAPADDGVAGVAD